MADDKKSIPDAGKVDDPTKAGKVEPDKAAPSVQDQPAPAKAEVPVIEDASKVVKPPAAEQLAPVGKEVSKDKGAPAPSKEGVPPPGKDEKQTTIPSMGDPAPAGKVVDFTAVREGAAKGKPPEKAAAPDKGKQADKAKDAAKPRRGRPPKADKAAPDKAKPQPRDKMSQSKPPAGKGAPATAKAPSATEQPPAPRDATRGVKEEIVYLNLSELHPFKNHPFGVRDDAEMQGLVESVKAAGVNQPALVRPREGGGYEIIAGHRRQRASELAGFVNMPCIVRNMTDDEAILAMTDDTRHGRALSVKGAWHRRPAAACSLRAAPAVPFPGRDGGISSRAAPFPMNGKGRGDRVEHHETEVFYEKTPCLYYRRMVRRGLQKHGTGGPVLSGGVRGGFFAYLSHAVSALVPQRCGSRGA